MRKGAVWVDMEDRERVLAIIHAAFRENDGDEMDAGGPQEWERS
jgi:hypothetical protein